MLTCFSKDTYLADTGTSWQQVNIRKYLTVHVLGSRWWKTNLHQSFGPNTTDASQGRLCFVWWGWKRGSEGFKYSSVIGFYCLHGHVWFSQPLSGVLTCMYFQCLADWMCTQIPHSSLAFIHFKLKPFYWH